MSRPMPRPKTTRQRHHHQRPATAVLRSAGQEQRVVREHVRPVRRSPTKSGGLNLVVVGEGEVHRGDQRVGEEDREADQPGRHERQGAQARTAALGASAAGVRPRAAVGRHRVYFGLRDVACRSACRRLAGRPGCPATLPALDVVARSPGRSSGTAPPLAAGRGGGGFGLPAMSRKVLKRGSCVSSGECSAASVEGTLWMALAKLTTASVSVVRNFTNSQAAFWCLLVRGDARRWCR